jgi:hypothetical protein
LARIISFHPETEITLAAALAKLRAAVAATDQPAPKTNGFDHATAPADLLDIAAAIAVIPNDDSDVPAGSSWRQWNDMGLRTHAAADGSEIGLALFLEWSRRSKKKFDDATTRARWKHYATSPPDRTNVGALYNRAREVWPRFVRPSEQARQARQDAAFEEFEKRQPPEPGPRKPDPPANNRRFPLVRFADIKLGDAPRCIVEDLIPVEGLVVVWGPPKCGKSFFTFDLVMHVALGWEYRGRRVEQGPVVYIAAEGELGIKARVEAFRQARIAEDGANPPFYLLTTRLDLVNDLDELITDVQAQLPQEGCITIVVDTLNRTIHGSESKDEDMGAYRDAADRLREEFHCAVLIIHHCGIDGSRPRGHTSLTGAVDAQFAVKRAGEKTILVTTELMKDGLEGAVIASQLAVVDVGFDRYGKPLSSCVVEPLETAAGPGKNSPKLSPAQARALEMLQQAIIAAPEIPPANNLIPSGKLCVHEKLWRDYCDKGAISAGDNPDTKRMAFKRAAEHLVAVKLVAKWDQWVWLCT